MASRIRAHYELLMKAPTTKKEEERKYLFANRLLLVTYYASGGLYHATGISKQIKYVYALANFAVFLVLVVSGNIYYAICIMQGSIPFDLFEIFGFLSVLEGCSFVIFFFPLFYTYFSQDIHETLSFLSTFKINFSKINLEFENTILRSTSGCDRSDDEPTRVLSKKGNVFKVPLLIYVCVTFLLILQNSSHLLHYILFVKSQRPPLAADYPVLPPYYDHIQSSETYIFVAGLYVFLVILCTIRLACIYPFILLLPALLHNNAVDICEKMNLVSQNFTQAFEAVTDQKKGPEGIICRSKLISAFERDMYTLRNEYEKCNRCVRTIHPFINYWMSLGGAVAYIALLATTAMLITTSLDPFQRFSFTCMLTVLIIAMFILCDAGKTFNDMDNLYKYAVYNLPWYYLPPKTRKIVSLLQTTVRNEKGFKLLWVYCYNMPLFPRICQNAYTCAHLLRAMK